MKRWGGLGRLADVICGTEGVSGYMKHDVAAGLQRRPRDAILLN